MSNSWGLSLNLSIFGESHGECVGIVIGNLPAGIKLDLDAIQLELDRRKPGKSSLETPRKEADKFKIISGYFNNHTTGAPLTMIIENTNTVSKDYSDLKLKPRPGHADFTAYTKYNGFNDYRGGGHFSGRLTAGLVFAGAIAKQLLKKQDIYVGAYIESIGDIKEDKIDTVLVAKSDLDRWSKKSFPTITDDKAIEMKSKIEQVRQEGNSIGGRIRCVGINIPIGLGDPFFESLESRLAHLIFAVPGVKGVAFGLGYELSLLDGLSANDNLTIKDGGFRNESNNAGGILGGITNGMPLDVQVTFKPTPSISIEQKTVNLETLKEEVLSIKGRHDPCIVPRAIPVIESCMALVLLDTLLGEKRI